MPTSHLAGPCVPTALHVVAVPPAPARMLLPYTPALPGALMTTFRNIPYPRLYSNADNGRVTPSRTALPTLPPLLSKQGGASQSPASPPTANQQSQNPPFENQVTQPGKLCHFCGHEAAVVANQNTGRADKK